MKKTVRSDTNLQPVVDRLAKSYTVSLKPRQQAILARRARELGVGRSILLQLLLDLEEREGFLRKEIRSRLRRAMRPRKTLLILDPETAPFATASTHD